MSPLSRCSSCAAARGRAEERIRRLLEPRIERRARRRARGRARCRARGTRSTASASPTQTPSRIVNAHPRASGRSRSPSCRQQVPCTRDHRRRAQHATGERAVDVVADGGWQRGAGGRAGVACVRGRIGAARDALQRLRVLAKVRRESEPLREGVEVAGAGERRERQRGGRRPRLARAVAVGADAGGRRGDEPLDAREERERVAAQRDEAGRRLPQLAARAQLGHDLVSGAHRVLPPRTRRRCAPALAKLSVRISPSAISRPIARSVHAMSSRMRSESIRPPANSGVVGDDRRAVGREALVEPREQLARATPHARGRVARRSCGLLGEAGHAAPSRALQMVDHPAPVVAHRRRRGAEQRVGARGVEALRAARAAAGSA